MATYLRSREIDDKSGWGISDPGAVRRRVWSGIAFLGLAFGGLLLRLWFLQVVRGGEMLARAQSNRIRRVPLQAPRGLILDRHGRVLASSRARHSVAIVPAALPSKQENPQERARILQTLGFLLGLSQADIEGRLREAREAGGHAYDPVRIVEDVDLPTITRIEENQLRLARQDVALTSLNSDEAGTGQSAVLVTNDLARIYPNGPLAAHVLGYTGAVTSEDLQRAAGRLERGEPARELAFDDTVGKSGIEKEYDTLLAGTPGAETFEVDSRLRPVRRGEWIGEKPGGQVMLTLDARMQQAAEGALAKARNSGAAAVVDVRSGEVLALASGPSFNPNIFSLPRPAFRKAYLQLVRNAKHPLINRAVTSRFPPGSTFKMVTASAGLERGTLNPLATHVCNGGVRLGRWFGCWKSHGAGIDLIDAIAGSCDTYFYEEALKLGSPEGSGPDYLAKIARGFGLGQKTGLDLPIDEDGLIPDTAWRRRVNARRPDLAHWFPGNTLNMSIGQGDVLATPLQMALVTAAVSNGGTLWRPHLMKEMRDPKTGKTLRYKPHGQSVGVSRAHLEWVRRGMRAVVTTGTGKSAALPNVSVAGKTGSAEDDHHGLPHAWFVAFAPYENPQIAIAVIVENSGHGSENAAPVAKAVLEAAFPAAKTD